MHPLLAFENLQKRHPGGEGVLFRQVSAAIAGSETVMLTGASGQGKSTLLRILGLLEVPDEGVIFCQGKPLGEWEPEKWRKTVAYAAQQPFMLPDTVGDNLRIVSRLHGTVFEEQLALRLMARSGLEAISRDKPAGELSGGEKQRLALVRTLLLRPAILLLDEVTSSLDPASKLAVEELLREWQAQEGTALLWVTHDLEQARRMNGRLWRMAEHTLTEGMMPNLSHPDAAATASTVRQDQPARDAGANTGPHHHHGEEQA